MPNNYPPMSFVAKTWALLRCRCPRCGIGKVFAGSFRMNDPCPVCRLVFERDEGYFLGAMYVSSLFSFILMGGGYFLAEWWLPTWNQYWLVLMVLAAYMLVVPIVFRYSRVIWIYAERWGCLTDVASGAYEKSQVAEWDHPELGNKKPPTGRAGVSSGPDRD